MLYNAAVIGGTGSVGKALVKTLLGSPQWGRVVLLGRRELAEFADQPQVSQHVVDMDRIDSAALEHLRGVDACFVTLGVGAPAKTTPEELKRIDVTVPSKFAQAAKTAGVRHMSILTAVNADVSKAPGRSTNAGSSTYAHFKGLVEENIAELNFESMVAVRPATLMGSANTPALAALAARCLRVALPAKWKDIHVDQVALAMRQSAEECMKNEGPPRTTLIGHSLFAAAAPPKGMVAE